jgi:hypothetical protein
MIVEAQAKRGTLAPPIGVHPDWEKWPQESKTVTISGVAWLLCTDGAYWVRMDGQGMLLPATFECDICGCPMHPHSSERVCPVHVEGYRRSGL